MVSNRRIVECSGADFYPTPSWGTEALLKYVDFTGDILEPCCGEGDMSEVLISGGYTVKSSDIINRGYGETRDFLSITTPQDNIVTNPPFNIAAEIINHALTIVNGKVCVLLRTAFLESKCRYNLFYRDNPPATVLVFSERLSMYPKGYLVKGGGTTSYAWFVWDNKCAGSDTKIKWIAPGMKPSSRRSHKWTP